MRFFLFIALLFSATAMYAETQQETLLHCREDIASGDLMRRRRAAMVVGKYDAQEAVQMAVECLRDEDAQVRQSALVSLTEKGSLPAEARLPIIRLLQDKNLHIRRLAASVLPECFGLNIHGRFNAVGNMRFKSGTPATAEATSEMQRIINAALEDNDAAVRRNVLQACFCYPFPLPPKSVERFFNDEEEFIRILALRAYLIAENRGCWNMEQLQKLSQDKSSKVRQEFASRLSCLNKEVAESLAKQMANDKDAAVSAAAIKSYVEMECAESFSVLTAALNDKRYNDAQKELFCRLLAHYPEKARPILNALSQQNGALGDYALGMILTGRYGDVTLELILKGCSSSIYATRHRALMQLLSTKDTLDDTAFRTLLQSHHPDVRLALIELLRNYAGNKELRNTIALDLCADDDSRVKQNAFKLLSSIRPEGWTEILMIALQEEESHELREAAALSLCQAPPDAEIAKALENYLPQASHQLNRRIGIYIKKCHGLK